MSGVLAEFDSEAALRRAAAALRAQALGVVETHSARAIEHDEADSVLPLTILVAGVLGAAGTFALQAYATVFAYPMNIGGRPDFSWPAYIPMAFEMGVLSAVATGFFGFLIANRMPALYDPIDEIDGFRRATRDGYFLALRTDDGAAIGRARAALQSLAPLSLQAIP